MLPNCEVVSTRGALLRQSTNPSDLGLPGWVAAHRQRGEHDLEPRHLLPLDFVFFLKKSAPPICEVLWSRAPPRSRRVPESCKIDVLPHPGTPTVHGGSPTSRARRTAAPMADQNGAPDGTGRRSRTRRPVERAPPVLKRGQKFQRALAECRELRVAWADEHTVGRNHKKRRREVYEKHGLDRYQWSQCYTKYRKHPHRRGHRAGHRVGG